MDLEWKISKWSRRFNN